MGEVRRIDEAGAIAGTELAGDTPTLRLFSLLELIASKDRPIQHHRGPNHVRLG